MRTISSSLLSFVFAAVTSVQLAGCMVGEGDEGTGDQDNELTFCVPEIVDGNADGIPDGIDTNCDGVIDQVIGDGGGGTTTPPGGGTPPGGTPPGGGGQSQQTCQTNTVENGLSLGVKCTTTNGTSTTCECRIDNQLVQTCSPASAANACSTGVNCCGF